ncbi:MAG TPA: hypothetical protein VK578_13820 [Edaphobacter sp.]|nr:hypothetical protein [Edaphobacter sp.]
MEISPTQQKRAEKISRLRKFYDNDSPRIYEWNTTDEDLNFSSMSDPEVAEYLKKTS